MGRLKKTLSELHYYSDRLKFKLNELRSAHITIVEAPPGYGKTTAVRDFLEKGLLPDIPVYWYAATEEIPSACFRRFAQVIGKIDSRAGERLLKIELPNAATIGAACDALRELQCRQEAYLVVDNFQFLLSALPPAFLSALIEHGGEGLHIILMTHMLKHNDLSAISGYGFLHITTNDLRLDAQDIRRYYAGANIYISPEDAGAVADRTWGWIIAVYLQLRAFREKGTFTDTRDILMLMENLIWSRLTQAQQDFLLFLSPLETVSVRQMCPLLGCPVLPGYAMDALSCPFIRYDPAEGRYEIHSILKGLLAQKRYERGAAFERDCFMRAGDLSREEGRIPEALSFYWQIKDYERMLSLDLSRVIFEKIGDVFFFTIALDAARNCPENIMNRHPLSMLQIAFAIRMTGKTAAFDALMDRLYPVLDMHRGMPELMGEWLLLSSFRHHPRLKDMTAVLKQAAPYFKGGCSQVILPFMPFCFGSCGPLVEYHIQPGEADNEADALEEYIALYSVLTGGHGSGADMLYRAELAYYRGDIDEAEILACKAGCLAQSKQQGIVHMGAALQTAQIALNKADTEGWQRAVDAMKRAASYPCQDSYVMRAAVDILRGILLTELNVPEGVAVWLKVGDFSGQMLLPAMVPLALLVHVQYLLHQGKAAQLIGIAQAEYLDGPACTPMLNWLLSLAVATGYTALNNPQQAENFVRRAGEAAVPDGLILNFATFSWVLHGRSDKFIQKECPALLERFQEMKERFGAGWYKLHCDLKQEKLPEDLTVREREVAQLAAKGLRNGEIARQLSISEATVRAHMRAVFQKLEIDRRFKLAEKLR
jgi:LuxR family maltose regulon positive regulatory protein